MSSHVVVIAVLPAQKCATWHDKVICAEILADISCKLNTALSFNEYVEAEVIPPTCEEETEELCKEVTDNKEKAEAVFKTTSTFIECL